jgi:hypothetical protein
VREARKDLEQLMVAEDLVAMLMRNKSQSPVKLYMFQWEEQEVSVKQAVLAHGWAVEVEAHHQAPQVAQRTVVLAVEELSCLEVLLVHLLFY